MFVATYKVGILLTASGQPDMVGNCIDVMPGSDIYSQPMQATYMNCVGKTAHEEANSR